MKVSRKIGDKSIIFAYSDAVMRHFRGCDLLTVSILLINSAMLKASDELNCRRLRYSVIRAKDTISVNKLVIGPLIELSVSSFSV